MSSLYPTIARTNDGTIFPSQTLTIANQPIGTGRTFVIAGPCSIRDEESFVSVSKQVIDAGADLLRGGAFKPRSNPASFQGLGVPALKIVEKVKEQFGVGYACEVTGEFRFPLEQEKLPLSKQDAEAMMHKKISVLDAVTETAELPWIGSRNGQSFDLIQSLAIKALSLGKPMMLKRGYWMTLDEYCSALEYVARLGCPVIACLRGIGTDSVYRYQSDIQDVPVLKERITVPIFVDPSHIAGDHHYVEQLAKEAVHAGADGLVIEISENREVELSDKDQAITPEVLKRIVDFAREMDREKHEKS